MYQEKFYSLLGQQGYQPLDEGGLARKLKIGAPERKQFHNWLLEEEKAGRVVSVKGGCYNLPQRAGLVAGRLQMTDRGMGFLIADDFDGPDIIIYEQDMGTALHGDRVLVRIQQPRPQRYHRGRRDNPRGNGRAKGEVARVLERKRTQIVGAFHKKGPVFTVEPDDSRIASHVFVRKPRHEIPLGYKVVVKLDEKRGSRGELHGEVTEVIGSPNAPGVDIISIIKKFELPEGFPEAVEREAGEIHTSIPREEIAKREDFRQLYTLTIDPDDAKDFDDALSYKVYPDGDFEIYVHIADVSFYVRPGSPLDIEAQRRGNSSYLVDRVIPMLPEKLSNGICSLQPNVDRLVKTAIMRIGPDGRVKAARFAQGIIHSRRRFTYQEAYKLLKRPPETEEATHLHALNKMARILRSRRMKNGALNLDFPEHKVRLDETGRPTRIERVENDESHQLIEEFMLLANEAVALQLRRGKLPAIYRIHDKPATSKLMEFSVSVRSFGISAGNLTLHGELQRFLVKVTGHQHEDAIKLQLLKSLPRAVYSHHERGHFGLAMDHYTHFTSPIRRYADLVVHRLLFEGKWKGDAAKMGRHLSETERRSAEAEGESVLLKKMEYMDRARKLSPKPVFKAMVTENKMNGMMLELPEIGIRGFLAIRDVHGDHFTLSEREQEWRGRKTHTKIRLGQVIQVEVTSVDLSKKQVNFSTRLVHLVLNNKRDSGFGKSHKKP